MRSVVFAYQDVGYVCLDVLLRLGAEIAAICEGIENRSDATESR